MKNWNIIVIALSLITLIGYCGPLFKNIGDIKNKNEILRAKFEDKKDLKKELKELQTTLAKTNIDKNIPFHADQENLIRDFVKILGKSSFDFDSLSFSLGKHGKLNIPQVLVNVHIKGLRSNIKSLLSYIEQNERFLGMDNLTFSTQEKNGIEFTSLSLSIFAPYQDN